MKFLHNAILLLASSAAVLALPTKTNDADTSSDTESTSGSQATSPSSGTTGGSQRGGVNEALVPDFGVKANTNPGARQQGSCDGFVAATNTVVNIPCTCPPARSDFLAALNKNVAAGSVQGVDVDFNNNAGDQSTATNQARATAMLVTLQNLFGAGMGCPAASAPNFAVQQRTGKVSSQVFVG